MTIDDKIFLRSISLLAQHMVGKDIEHQQQVADEIKKLVEDRILAAEKESNSIERNN